MGGGGTQSSQINEDTPTQIESMYITSKASFRRGEGVTNVACYKMKAIVSSHRSTWQPFFWGGGGGGQ